MAIAALMPRIQPPNVGAAWAAWRVAGSSLCSGLEELDRRWSLEDIADACEFLDVEADAKRAWNKAAEQVPRAGETAPIDLARAPSAEAQAEIDRTLESVRDLAGLSLEEIDARLAELEAAAPDPEA